MAGKRVRWECPNGLHPGVLSSSRPPLDSIARYCLPCSEVAGRLVKRSAPALERQRASRAAAAASRRVSATVAARAREEARWTVETSDGESINVRDLMDAMFRGSIELQDRARESGRNARWRPEVNLRRGSKAHVSGRCTSYGEITITVGAGADSHEVREVLLHEIVHAATVALVPRTRGRRANSHGREWHGSLYRTALCRAARELFGTTVHPDDHREVYGLDALILEQMRGG
jgi:hypothetical protein